MTKHEIIVGNGNRLKGVGDGSIQPIVASPPYPMVEMWDGMIGKQNPKISAALGQRRGGVQQNARFA